jgi:hypothetical protein
MSEVDIIELGDDGSFDITSTKPVKQQVIEEVDYSSCNWEEEELKEQATVLDTLQANEYQIYKGEDDYLAIVRLEAEQVLQDVAHSADELLVRTKDGAAVRVPLPDNVKIENIHCKYYKDFVTIKFTSK